jgi:hypothetical protein
MPISERNLDLSLQNNRLRVLAEKVVWAQQEERREGLKN